jgi:hypothetical protein
MACTPYGTTKSVGGRELPAKSRIVILRPYSKFFFWNHAKWRSENGCSGYVSTNSSLYRCVSFRLWPMAV